MNWDDFRVFLALARSGTLTGAAGTLGLTQPTVGRRLKAMEARGGVRLLERTPDGFDLTEAGAMLLASAERMEIEAQTAERSVAGRDIRLEGSVRITTIEVLAQTFLVAVVDRVQRTHPGIRIEILPDTRALSLSKREADLAVRVAPFSGSELVTRRLADVGVGIYASRGYLDRRPAPDRLITVLDDQRHLDDIRSFHDAFPDAEVALASNDRGVLAAAAASGLGLVCLPNFVARTSDGLVKVASPEVSRRSLWLGVHSDLRTVPRIRVVLDAITAVSERQRALFA